MYLENLNIINLLNYQWPIKSTQFQMHLIWLIKRQIPKVFFQFQIHISWHTIIWYYNHQWQFLSFCEHLYESELQADAQAFMDFFPLLLSYPSYLMISNLLSNAPMSRDEVLHSIKWMRSGKSSGLDGLSSELYMEVQDIDPLLNMFNDSFEMSFLPMSSGETNISLILRKDEQPEDWAFYGPLSLLNLDLKLLSKILALRLEDLLLLLIKEDQTENSVFHQWSIDGLVISLYTEKAFDSVE